MLHYTKRIAPILIWMYSLINISACIRDDIRCNLPVTIGLDYSYNILNTNMLDEKSDRAALHIFDQEGVLVIQRDIGDGIGELSLPALKPGKYHFVAHARSTDVISEWADLYVPRLTEKVSGIEKLTAYLKRSDNGVQNNRLNDFLIGYTISDIDANIGNRVQISLKSAVKRIRITLLPTTGGVLLDPDRYNFKITDNVGNGHIKYDYTQLPDEAIIYKPYYKTASSPDTPTENEVSSAVMAEINSTRLIEQNRPYLTISDNSNNREIVRVNLTWLLSLTNMENNKGRWSLQEYLDRQDNFAITLFVDTATGSWLKSTIIINGWVLNMEDIDF